MPASDSPPPANAAPRPYHHGNLRQALIEATIQLVRTRGLDHVTVREAARLAGVSPGAPFRHFPSRVALLTAVAEEALDLLIEEIDRALTAAEHEGPLRRYRAIGIGYLRWAISYPAHFQVISNRAVIDFEGSTLRRRNDGIRARMTELMLEAQAAGLLRPGDLTRQQIAGRALAYGLARMHVDGQFPSWSLNPEGALQESVAIFDQFMASIAATERRPEQR